MNIISKEKDFRGLDNFVVKITNKNEDLKQEFIKKFPYHDISVLKYENQNNIFQVIIIPMNCFSF